MTSKNKTLVKSGDFSITLDDALARADLLCPPNHPSGNKVLLTLKRPTDKEQLKTAEAIGLLAVEVRASERAQLLARRALRQNVAVATGNAPKLRKHEAQRARTREQLHRVLDTWIDRVEAHALKADDGEQHTLTLRGWLDTYRDDDEPLFGYSMVHTEEETL